MSLRTFIHMSNKRVKTPTLLDSGATENFINANYAQYLCLPVKRLTTPRKVYNIDGTSNRKGDIVAYMDFVMPLGLSCWHVSLMYLYSALYDLCELLMCTTGSLDAHTGHFRNLNT